MLRCLLISENSIKEETCRSMGGSQTTSSKRKFMETSCQAGFCGFKIGLQLDSQRSWAPLLLLQKSSANGPILQRNLASWGQLCCLKSWQHFPMQVPAVMSHQNIWRVCFTDWHCRYIEVCFCFTEILYFVIMFDSDCKRNWRRGGKGGKGERKQKKGKCVQLWLDKLSSKSHYKAERFLKDEFEHCWQVLFHQWYLISFIPNWVLPLSADLKPLFPFPPFPAPLGDLVIPLVLCLLQPIPSSYTM